MGQKDNLKVIDPSLTPGGLKEDGNHDNSKNSSSTVETNPSITSVANQLPTQVTAQLIQTSQGPRIILQGIQGSNIPKEQLAGIQQQVKNQLLKAQAEAKRDGKVPPTKIVVQLPPSMQAKLQPEPIVQANKTDVADEVKPPVLASQQQTSQQQQQQVTINQPVSVVTSGADNG